MILEIVWSFQVQNLNMYYEMENWKFKFYRIGLDFMIYRQ